MVQALERLGVEVAFGLPGVHNLAIWKALSESSVRLVGVRHEQAAGFAAEGGDDQLVLAVGETQLAVCSAGPPAPRLDGLRRHPAAVS